jgi:hypothetical protein
VDGIWLVLLILFPLHLLQVVWAGERYIMRSTSRLDAFSAPSACQSNQATASIDGVRVIKTPNRNSRIAASELQNIPSKNSLLRI